MLLLAITVYGVLILGSNWCIYENTHNKKTDFRVEKKTPADYLKFVCVCVTINHKTHINASIMCT